MYPSDFKCFFKGEWHFERQVSDFYPEDTFIEGRATFKDTSTRTQSLYTESGAFIHKGQDIPFQNSYIYDFSTPNTCHILFPDSRPFYALSHQKQAIEHICGQDTYHGFFEIISKEQWTLSWKVSGPRKNYSIKMIYFCKR